MLYEVWHADPANFLGDLARAKALAGYKHVANVEARDRDDVFEKTNHIDSDWTRNPGVEMKVFEPVRSTSVGDIILSLSEGAQLMVSGVGFEPL